MCRKILGLVLAIAVFSACGNNAQEVAVRSHDLEILQDKIQVKSAAVDIMRLLGCVDVPARVDQFVTQLSPKFIRKPGEERWGLKDELDLPLKNKIWGKFEELGFFDAIAPREQSYEYIVVLGGALSSMRKRLGYVKQLWEQGIRTKSLVFLTGDRVLESFENAEVLNDRTQVILPIQASWQASTQHPVNEPELMKEIWLQAELPIDLAALPCQIIIAPQRPWPDGSLHRPNTGDTLEWWVKDNPAPGRALFISNQPYIGYQDAVIRRWMPTSFSVETVGPEVARDSQKVSLLIDTLLRWLAFEAFHCKLWDEQKLELYLKQK